MAAISYKCSYCDQENWTEETKRGTFRDCNHCGRPVQVPGSKLAAPGLKTCPHCAESDLQPAAKVCKHCGKSLAAGDGSALLSAAIAFALVGLLVFPVLLLPAAALGIVWLVTRLI